MGYDAEWKRLVSRLSREIAREVAPEVVRQVAQALVSELKRQLYEGHYVRIRSLDRMSEKLIYHHLLVHQPQSFTGIRRSLDIGKKTVDRALKKLRRRGYVVQDGQFLYWLTEPQETGLRNRAGGLLSAEEV